MDSSYGGNLRHPAAKRTEMQSAYRQPSHQQQNPHLAAKQEPNAPLYGYGPIPPYYFSHVQPDGRQIVDLSLHSPQLAQPASSAPYGSAAGPSSAPHVYAAHLQHPHLNSSNRTVNPSTRALNAPLDATGSSVVTITPLNLAQDPYTSYFPPAAASFSSSNKSAPNSQQQAAGATIHHAHNSGQFPHFLESAQHLNAQYEPYNMHFALGNPQDGAMAQHPQLVRLHPSLQPYQAPQHQLAAASVLQQPGNKPIDPRPQQASVQASSAGRAEPLPQAVHALPVQPIASNPHVIGALPSFSNQLPPMQRVPERSPAPVLPAAAVAAPSSEKHVPQVQVQAKQVAAQPAPSAKWKLDITKIPLSPADANRTLVFIGCPGPVDGDSVMKDLQAVGANLPASMRTQETWNRGSFVMSFKDRKTAINFHKRLHNTNVSRTHPPLKYYCELHHPPHTALAKLFREAGLPNPLDRSSKAPVASSAPAAPSAQQPAQAPQVAANAKPIASSSAPAPKAAPSFGGPSAPASASPYGSSSNPAAKKAPAANAKVPPSAAKKIAVRPSAAPSANQQAPQPVQQPQQPVQAQAKPSRRPKPKGRMIEGVFFEEIIDSEWIRYYNASTMLVARQTDCDICLDDITRGQAMVTLGCLCLFHQHCIDDWFDQCVHHQKHRHPFCPTHKEVLPEAIEKGILQI